MFEIVGEQVTTMQDERITNAYRDHPQTLLPRELRAVAEAKGLLQAICDISPEAIEQLILALPMQYREMAIQAAAEQFVIAMRLQTLQLVALFYQQAEREGISAEDRDETLQDVEADIHSLGDLIHKLVVNTPEALARIGEITVGVRGLSQCSSAENVQSWLYDVSSVYQDTLEQGHFVQL